KKRGGSVGQPRRSSCSYLRSSSIKILFSNITRILIGLLFFRSHFKRVDLTLRYRTEVVVRLDLAIHYLNRMVSFRRAADFICGSVLFPFLRANQVIPTVSFTEVFARPFFKDIVDVNVRRSGRNHSSAVVLDTLRVGSVVEALFTCAGADDVDQVICRLASYGSSTLHCRFCSDEVQFRELSNIEGTRAGGVRLTQAVTVVRTVCTQLP